MPRYGVHAMVWVGGWSQADAQRAINPPHELAMTCWRFGFSIPTRSILLTRGFFFLEKAKLKAAGSPVCRRTPTSRAAISPKSVGGAVLEQSPARPAPTFGGDYLGGVIYSALDEVWRGADGEGPANAVAVICDLAREARTIGDQSRLGGGQQLRDQFVEHRRGSPALRRRRRRSPTSTSTSTRSI